MNVATRHAYWTKFLNDYSDQNKGRLSRIGVFEGENDYWLENGLPLSGIDVDAHGDLPTVEIMLDGFTHTVKDVRALKAHLSLESAEDGLDLVDADGRATILRFEN